MDWHKLNKNDTNLYKGLAILMIVIHNFMHLFPTPKEMEFEFYDERFFIFLNKLNQPENIIQILFSYLGHFGVQIFIFLSAYGLTKRYQSNPLIFGPYLLHRFTTIYPSFLLAILLWAIVTAQFQYGILGPLKVIYWDINSIILKITLLSNFFSSEVYLPVGPWWFIPFIFQFYFTFPILLKIYSRWGNTGLLILSAFSIAFTLAVQGKIAEINLYFTIIGHLPEFCLGLYLAKNDDNGLKTPRIIIIMAIVLYILGNIYEPFWYVNHISFLIILLALYSQIVPKIDKNKIAKKIFIFFGSISMPLFLVNGFLRNPFINWAKDTDHWLLTLVLCLMSLSLSVIVALALLKSESYLKSLIKFKPKK